MENQSRSSSAPRSGGSGGTRNPRSDRGGDHGPNNREGQRRFAQPQRRICIYCKDKNKVIDYKNGDQLRRYLTDRGKIRPRRKIGTCARHQRELAVAIKRARQLALLPFAPEHVRGMTG